MIVIKHANAELHWTTSIENLNLSSRVKFNSRDPTKSRPKLIYDILSPAITQFQMKSSSNTHNELENIRALVSKLLETYMTLEACFVDSCNIDKSIKVTSKGTLTMKLKITPQSGEETEINNRSKYIIEGTTLHASIPNECNCIPYMTSNRLPPNLLHP